MSKNKSLISFCLGLFIFGFGCVRQIPIDDSNTVEQLVDITNLKTYTNKDCGFVFDYPNDWTLISNNGGDISVAVAGPETIKNSMLFFETIKDEKNTVSPPKSFDFSVDCLPDIKIFIARQDQNLSATDLEKIKSLSEYISANINHPYGPFFSIFESMKINEQKAYQVALPGHSVRFAIWIERGSHVFELTFPDIENPNQLSLIQQQILSSFRFVE